MKGTLLLAHGSRRKETEQTMAEVCGEVRSLTGGNVTFAFMEFSENNIEAGLERLRADGAREVCVVPYFLFDGVHIHEDIPAELAAYQAGHPEMRVRFGRTLGADRRLAEIVADRIREAQAQGQEAS
ncbi:MAG: CbiX/SirB N-terminal domain-containing protein [Clostridiales Family XIII bacterium]|jgi:sirohydrochlorin ferrochelatase|nr:CbiX/SirB N-terminal domain-containing protein [Clostridiales Family XIII bacterium]